MDGPLLRGKLDLLVAGMTGLKHSGRFREPNLDGSEGDYISFTSWEWPQGVGLYGLVHLWQRTRRADLRTLIETWYTDRLAETPPPFNVNTTAPMLALAVLWGETRDSRWTGPLDDWANRVIADMPRTLEGGFEHNVSDRVNDHELWDDTLFMVALFLAAYGEASGRRELVDEAERAGILDLLDLATITPSVRLFLLGIVEAQVAALLKLQAATGAWRTLLDDRDSYEEISATAGIGYGLLKGFRIGLGTPAWRDAGLRALDAVIRNIDDTGTVLNVSFGTRMGHDLQFYRDIPIQPTGYGQALAILCLSEGLDHIDAKEQAA